MQKVVGGRGRIIYTKPCKGAFRKIFRELDTSLGVMGPSLCTQVVPDLWLQKTSDLELTEKGEGATEEKSVH